jgi:hypothetical protein
LYVSYRITSLILGLVIAVIIFWIVRKDRLHVRYSMFWLLIALTSLLLGAFPGINDWVAVKLGINYPPILLVVVVMGAILIKMMTMDIDLSSQEKKMRTIAERLAILEAEKGPREE